MSISFLCTCGRHLHARDVHVGKRARCPECGASVVVPSKNGEALKAQPLERVTVVHRADEDAFEEEVAAAARMPSGSWHPDDALEGDPAPDLKGLVPAPPPLPAVSAPRPEKVRAPIREPWAYAFLDRYATIARNGVVFTSAALIIIGTLGYLYQTYYVLRLQVEFHASFWSLLLSSGLITLCFVLGVAVYLMVFVVPLLLFLALIHVAVDIGRNLRQVRAVLERGE